MTLLEELKMYALNVRNKCKQYAFDERNENKDWYGREDLFCMCAVASYTLIEYLRRRNIRGKLIASHNHCWVQVQQYFIDITCSQYRELEKGMPDYLVLPEKEFRKYMRKIWHFDRYRVITGLDIKHHFSSWGEYQQPSKEVTEEILKIGESNV